MLSGNRFADATTAREFMLAGRAIITLRSLKTDQHYTYKIRKAKSHAAAPWFVMLLTNGDQYVYMGVLAHNNDASVTFRLTKKSRLTVQAPSVKAFAWAWNHLGNSKLPDQLEIRHEGRCGCCGRPLTRPDSLERGIGPECAAKFACN